MADALFLSGDEVPDYLRSVELMSAGMSWAASTGEVSITMEHLADAVIACNEDPMIQCPRVKLGHSSPLNGGHEDHNPFAIVGDAEPAFGQFHNLRLENDGAVLVGDATNVPVWLAAMAPSAYPSRSAEATWQIAAADFDVQTNAGRRYKMVVTAVSLLGVYIPAISDLEDLSTLIMAGPSALATDLATTAATGIPSTAATDLSVSTSVIRERFNFDWAMSENDAEPDTYWWWARDIRVDANEVIADDDEGGLWSVSYSTDGADTVTFGEPVRVRETFVPVAAATPVASFSRPSKPDKSSRPAAVAASNHAAESRPDPEGGAMDDDVREILVGLGLDPETASAEQITSAEAQAAIDRTSPAPVTEPEGTEPVEPTAQTDPEATPERTPERTPVAASRQVPDGMRLIDADELDRLRAGAAAGTQLAREKATETRDRVLSAARDEGRFPPARLAHYSKLYDADPEGTKVLLTADEDKGGLAKGTVPLEARAVAPDPAAGPVVTDEDGLLPDNVSLLNRDERALLRARRSA